MLFRSGANGSLIALKAAYIPGYWVIGRDGKVVWNKESEGTMESAIEAALQIPAASPTVVPEA